MYMNRFCDLSCLLMGIRAISARMLAVSKTACHMYSGFCSTTEHVSTYDPYDCTASNTDSCFMHVT